MKKIFSIIGSNNFLIRLAILNVIIISGLFLYNIIIQFFQFNYSSASNIIFDIGLRTLGGFVFAGISSLPYIIGWYFNTKLNRKLPLGIIGIIIFIVMNYQFWHPLFTQNSLPFGIGFILIPVLLNIIMLIAAVIIYIYEHVKENTEASVIS